MANMPEVSNGANRWRFPQIRIELEFDSKSVFLDTVMNLPGDMDAIETTHEPVAQTTCANRQNSDTIRLAYITVLFL